MSSLHSDLMCFKSNKLLIFLQLYHLWECVTNRYHTYRIIKILEDLVRFMKICKDFIFSKYWRRKTSHYHISLFSFWTPHFEVWKLIKCRRKVWSTGGIVNCWLSYLVNVSGLIEIQFRIYRSQHLTCLKITGHWIF